MNITNMKITEIHPYEKNPRINDAAVEAVAKSIKEFGFRVPLVLDKDNVIITGHTRLRSAKLLGLTEVPCIIADNLTPEQVQAYRIADNKTGEIAEWDYTLLPMELKDLQEANFDLSLLGFDGTELDQLLNGGETAVTEGETEPDAVPEVPETPESRRGEIYQLGAHRLLCGDSTRQEDIAKLMGDEQADLYLVDPPYNVALTGSNGLTIQNDNMSDGKFREFLNGAFACASSVLKPGGSFYIFHGDCEAVNFRLAARDNELDVHETLYWVKNSFNLGRFDYHLQSEAVLYGWKPGASHNWYSDRCQCNLLNFDKPKCNDVHPCLSPDTLVMTASGYMPVEEIACGDQVLGDDGRFHAVKSVSSHPYHEKIVEIKVSGTNMKDKASHNHKYLIARKDENGELQVSWMEAGLIRKDDFLMTPQVQFGPLAPVNELDAWCYGLWAAQGSFLKAGHGEHKYPVFTLNKEKAEQIEKIKHWAGDAKVGIYPSRKSNAVTVMIFDNDKGKDCRRICGKYAHFKKFSPEVFNWTKELRLALFEGYMAGDGCVISTRGHRHSKSASKQLATQLKFISESLGYKANIYHYPPPKKRPCIRGRQIHTRDFYSTDYHNGARRFDWREFEWNNRKYWLRRVKEIRHIQYNGEVINLNVDGVHTFQTACGMTHNSMKPVEMLVYLIGNSSQRAGVVLDNFGGSGSTLIACEQTGRKCRMIELDEKYCDVIRRRWAEFTHGEGCDWKSLTPAINNEKENN